MNRLRIPSEIIYLFSVVLLAFAVALSAAADFGVSMVAAPAYLLSLKTGFLSFGVAEYVFQGILFIIMCVILRKCRFAYFFSFLTSLFYGAVLDLFRLIPFLNPAVMPPGSLDLWLRILLFVLSVILTGFSLSLCFKTYLYPKVFDFFIKCLHRKYGFKTHRIKFVFDASCLVISMTMTLLFFGRIEGVGFGSFLIVATNWLTIKFFNFLLDKTVEPVPLFPKFAQYFSIP